MWHRAAWTLPGDLEARQQGRHWEDLQISACKSGQLAVEWHFRLSAGHDSNVRRRKDNGSRKRRQNARSGLHGAGAKVQKSGRPVSAMFRRKLCAKKSPQDPQQS